jgi:hypothetical protein
MSQSGDPYAVALALGLACVEPEPAELFIDLDDPRDDAHLDLMIALLNHNGIVTRRGKTITSKGGHAHVYVTCDWLATVPIKLRPIIRIALQACLGSDRSHELLSLLTAAYHQSDAPPTVFFEVQ